ncbi:hypothetical protein SEA_FIZZLES_12 [Microbacterium phage Fizzles]|nr:hypothetical protein SEA_FIZZLES_12 [Microbacterium phage Fizzles]
MSTDAARLASLARRDRVITAVEDLLEVGAGLHDVLAAVGRDYGSLRRTLKGAGRLDLMLKLKAMQEADTARLNYALGRQWQA